MIGSEKMNPSLIMSFVVTMIVSAILIPLVIEGRVKN